MGNKIELEILGLSSSQSQSGSFALVLGEVNGNRRLPIIIGMFEAQAIAIEIEKIKPHRPMTHDLFKTMAQEFNYRVEEINIVDLAEGVFFANIVCDDDIKKVEIDSRPSDAIAIGVRFDAPIYTTEKIMSEAGIVLGDEDEESLLDEAESLLNEPEVEGEEETAVTKTAGVDYTELSVEQLNLSLNDALEAEDYELAARLRDEIEKRKK